MQPLGQESTNGKILEIDRVTQELILNGNILILFILFNKIFGLC